MNQHRLILATLAVALMIISSGTSYGFWYRLDYLPANAPAVQTFKCALCHNQVAGSNSFGAAWRTQVNQPIAGNEIFGDGAAVWEAIRREDSDGDRSTNEEELFAGSNPGDSESTPSDPKAPIPAEFVHTVTVGIRHPSSVSSYEIRGDTILLVTEQGDGNHPARLWAISFRTGSKKLLLDLTSKIGTASNGVVWGEEGLARVVASPATSEIILSYTSRATSGRLGGTDLIVSYPFNFSSDQNFPELEEVDPGTEKILFVVPRLTDLIFNVLGYPLNGIGDKATDDTTLDKTNTYPVADPSVFDKFKTDGKWNKGTGNGNAGVIVPIHHGSFQRIQYQGEEKLLVFTGDGGTYMGFGGFSQAGNPSEMRAGVARDFRLRMDHMMSRGLPLTDINIPLGYPTEAEREAWLQAWLPTVPDDLWQLGKGIMFKLDDQGDWIFERVFAKGLRNPWSVNYLESSERVAVGIVGQSNIESAYSFGLEDNRLTTTTIPNLGWPPIEGGICGTNQTWPYNPYPCLEIPSDPPAGLIEPVFSYGHGEIGRCIIGAGIIRSPYLPADWQGRYMGVDFVTGRRFHYLPTSNSAWERESVSTETSLQPSAFHQTAAGVLVATDRSSGEVIYFATESINRQLHSDVAPQVWGEYE